MSKSKKLLRKLLSKFRDEIVCKPFSKSNSGVVDCIEVIMERLSHEKNN